MVKTQKGFTLVEWMVVVAIVGILAVIAIPNFRMLFIKSQLNSYAEDITNTFYLARSEALKRGVNVTVCSMNETKNGCGNATDWFRGAIVYWGASLDMSTNVLYVKQIDDTLTVLALPNSNSIVFNSRGSMNTGSDFALTVKDINCLVDEKIVTISTIGVAAVNEQTCSVSS